MLKLKGLTASKPKPARVSRLLYIFAAVVLLAGLAVVFRGWIRVTAVPKTATIIYLPDVASTLTTQRASLGNPITSLGFATDNESRQCGLEIAQNIHEEVDCNATKQSYTKLSLAAAGMNAEEQTAARIQSQLKAQRWHAGSNGVTLTGLVDGVYHGIDYSPDANYEKVIGKTDCVFDVMIAYSNPQPPALRATFTCDRTIDFFGTPKGQFYNSAHGHF